MSAHCQHDCNHTDDPIFRRVLWFALVINAGMFVVEIIAGHLSDSLALQADALDFFADAANYALSLFVLGSAASVRAKASLFKAACMLFFAVFVLSQVIVSFIKGSSPEPVTMGFVGVLALAANVLVAFLLFRYRDGDSNMQSIWLCSRNDAIGNLAVVCAALGVLGTGSAWPDLVVAMIMAALAFTASVRIFKLARQELIQIED